MTLRGLIFIFFLLQCGGPIECTTLSEWRTGLVADNNTWAVIDRGHPNSRDTVPIWKLIDNQKAFGQQGDIKILDKDLLKKALSATCSDRYVSSLTLYCYIQYLVIE